MTSLTLVPLEPLKARYTEQLLGWEKQQFSASGFDLTVITPDEEKVSDVITTGEVLDAVGRPTWALQQTQRLLHSAPDIGSVWFSDFYHPGLDALAYSRSRFKAFSFCWAQTFDQHDFTRKVHLNWMRPWEVMAFEIYSCVFVAHELLRDLIATALPHVADKVFVVGLPFNSAMVQRQLTDFPSNRTIDVVYTSRLDAEKNPGLFLDLVELFQGQLTFALCTGHDTLRGDPVAVARALALKDRGLLTVFYNSSKADYYKVLASSRIQFNCASQDWISFTLLEALTFGCRPLYPATRSFVSTLDDWRFMYHPSAQTNVVAEHIEHLLTDKLVMDADQRQLASRILGYHNNTLKRIAELIKQTV